jgi:Holliday junction resolvase-like predicted endonuclease
MKNGDISNVSSPQLIVTADVVVKLVEEETRRLLAKKVSYKVGDIDLLATNKLWLLSNNYGLSLELAGFESENWTEELLEKSFEKLERRVVNPFNYWQLYENVEELVGLLPYRPNLKGIVDKPDRVARYGSAGIELANI